MPIYNTTNLIDNLEAATEAMLNKAISEWQNLPAQALNYTDEQGKWSAVQCLDHLNSYGKFYLPQLKKAIQIAADNHQAATKEFTSGWLGNYFTNLMKPAANGKLSKKMKAPKNHLPALHLNASSVVATFINQQEEILLLLRAAKKVNLNTVRVPISLTAWIKLKLGDVFMFLIAHNERHVLQAEKSLKAFSKLK